MKLIRTLILLLGFCASPIYAFSQNNTGNNYFLHTVSKGQSLYSIAGMYGVSIDDIVRLNPGSESQINAGSTLKIPQIEKNNQRDKTFHTIQPGETLYQLTQKYNVSVKDICDVNPGLSASNFKSGQVIVIPLQQEKTPRPVAAQTGGDKRKEWREMHKVDKDETLTSISVKYGVTEQELIAMNPEVKNKKLRRGTFLFIPYSTNQKENTANAKLSNETLFNEQKTVTKKIRTIRAALILPFMAGESGNQDDRLRMIEFYQGFLLSMDSLKRQGVSIDLYTYDSKGSTSEMGNILDRPEMKNMHVIFGAVASQNIHQLATFAKVNKVRVVIPFAPKVDDVFNNPYVYQINTPQSYLYSEVYDHFLRKFPKSKVVFIDTDNSDREKMDFVQGLKNELRENKVTFKEIKVGVDIVTEQIVSLIDTTRHTVFVPMSGDNKTLSRIIPQLTELHRTHPNVPFALFGYPEWQTYTRDYVSKYYLMDTYFYTSFYTNTLFPAAVQFASSFRKWYGKDMANTYPKYGMLGFDIGYYFFKGLYQEGSGFDRHLDDVKVIPIQTGFKFERVNTWGGFINKKVFFVNFNRKYELIKHDFE